MNFDEWMNGWIGLKEAKKKGLKREEKSIRRDLQLDDGKRAEISMIRKNESIFNIYVPSFLNERINPLIMIYLLSNFISGNFQILLIWFFFCRFF